MIYHALSKDGKWYVTSEDGKVWLGPFDTMEEVLKVLSELTQNGTYCEDCE